jgi:hypothetical protein
MKIGISYPSEMLTCIFQTWNFPFPKIPAAAANAQLVDATLQYFGFLTEGFEFIDPPLGRSSLIM